MRLTVAEWRAVRTYLMTKTAHGQELSAKIWEAIRTYDSDWNVVMDLTLRERAMVKAALDTMEAERKAQEPEPKPAGMRADFEHIIFEEQHGGTYQEAVAETIDNLFRCIRDAMLDPEMPAQDYDRIEEALDRAGITKGIVGR